MSNEAPLKIVMLPSGKRIKIIYLSRSLIEIVELKDVNLHLYWHNVIQEKILLATYPEEPSHHYVAKDNLPMMIEA